MSGAARRAAAGHGSHTKRPLATGSPRAIGHVHEHDPRRHAAARVVAAVPRDARRRRRRRAAARPGAGPRSSRAWRRDPRPCGRRARRAAGRDRAPGSATPTRGRARARRRGSGSTATGLPAAAARTIVRRRRSPAVTPSQARWVRPNGVDGVARCRAVARRRSVTRRDGPGVPQPEVAVPRGLDQFESVRRRAAEVQAHVAGGVDDGARQVEAERAAVDVERQVPAGVHRPAGLPDLALGGAVLAPEEPHRRVALGHQHRLVAGEAVAGREEARRGEAPEAVDADLDLVDAVDALLVGEDEPLAGGRDRRQRRVAELGEVLGDTRRARRSPRPPVPARTRARRSWCRRRGRPSRRARCGPSG